MLGLTKDAGQLPVHHLIGYIKKVPIPNISFQNIIFSNVE